MAEAAKPGFVRVIRMRPDRSPATRLLPGEVMVRGDRSHPVLGNPFVLKNKHDEAERDRVIAAFVAHARDDLARGGPISREINALAERVASGESLALACWCKPRRCHLDWIADQICQRAYAGVPPATLYAAIEPLRLACEARHVLGLHTTAERRTYLSRVRERRGEDAAARLKAAVMAEHAWRKAKPKAHRAEGSVQMELCR